MAGDDRPVGVERLLFLRSMSVARVEGPEAVQIAGAMREVFFQRGKQLFDIGDPSGDVFFLVKGSVQMTATGAPPWDFDAPAIVGAFDSFAERPRARRAVATSDLHALALAHSDWLAVMEEHHEFACEAVLRLATMLGKMRLGIAGGGYAAPSPAEEPRRAGLGVFDRTLALRRLSLFQSAGVEAMMRLAEIAREIDLAAGEALFAEGEPSDSIDVVVGGAIAVERAAPPLQATFGPGTIVGGAAALAVGPHPFSARAERDSVVLRVRGDDLLDLMEDHFDLTRAVIAGVNVEREALMRLHGQQETGPR